MTNTTDKQLAALALERLFQKVEQTQKTNDAVQVTSVSIRFHRYHERLDPTSGTRINLGQEHTSAEAHASVRLSFFASVSDTDLSGNSKSAYLQKVS